MMSNLRYAAIPAILAAFWSVGCSGQVGQPEKTSTSSFKLVDLKEVTGDAPSCSEGFAPGNVCCRGGTTQQAECGVWVDEPFHPCDAGWTTYPHPKQCCSLSDGSACAGPDTPVTGPSGGISGSGGAGYCSYACPPGWSHPIGGSATECCTLLANGAIACIDQAMGAAPVEENAAGVATPGFACPAGWSQASDAPNACCRESADGARQCMGGGSASGGSAGSGPSAGSGSAAFTCPSGWLPEGTNSCCQTQPSGAKACMGWAGSAGGQAPNTACPAGTTPYGNGCCETQPDGTTACAGQAENPSGGTDAPSSGASDPVPNSSACPVGLVPHPGVPGICCGELIPGGPQGCAEVVPPAPTPVACPEGWDRSPNAADVCCHMGEDGVGECLGSVPDCPEGTSPINNNPVTCCRYNADGSGECGAPATPVPMPVSCPAGTDYREPGLCCGRNTDPNSTAPCFPIGNQPAPICSTACPAGFTSQPGAPDVCCRTEPNGAGMCFSQARGPVATSGGVGGSIGTAPNTQPPSAGSSSGAAGAGY